MLIAVLLQAAVYRGGVGGRVISAFHHVVIQPYKAAGYAVGGPAAVIVLHGSWPHAVGTRVAVGAPQAGIYKGGGIKTFAHYVLHAGNPVGHVVQVVSPARVALQVVAGNQAGVALVQCCQAAVPERWQGVGAKGNLPVTDSRQHLAELHNGVLVVIIFVVHVDAVDSRDGRKQGRKIAVQYAAGPGAIGIDQVHDIGIVAAAAGAHRKQDTVDGATGFYGLQLRAPAGIAHVLPVAAQWGIVIGQVAGAAYVDAPANHSGKPGLAEGLQHIRPCIKWAAPVYCRHDSCHSMLIAATCLIKMLALHCL